MARSASLVPDIGGKERRYMSNVVNYTNAPSDIEQALDDATVIRDFLPSPEELVSRGEKKKITIAVDKRSLELFKEYAKKHKTKYQPMMNGVLSSYAGKFLDK
ncbi:MAG TPA: CopG family transcriptional regulator [Candidatus Saccharimonadia bacterium]|nr:CopG family transcriptional regulator [Candidatus Saccharimonadia bacterium]